MLKATIARLKGGSVAPWDLPLDPPLQTALIEGAARFLHSSLPNNWSPHFFIDVKSLLLPVYIVVLLLSDITIDLLKINN